MPKLHNIMRMGKKGFNFLFSMSVMLCIFSSPAFADDRQYKIEAAYLYSFFNYITWPGYSSPEQLSKPSICVVGNDPIVPYLEYIRLKMAGERTINIRNVDGPDDSAGCQVYFVRHRILSSLSGLPNDTLVVFKPDDPLDRGGMIELSEEKENISINIDQEQLEKNGFQVSSRLLDLANRR